MAPRPLNRDEVINLERNPICRAGSLAVEHCENWEWARFYPCTAGHCQLYRLHDADERLVYVGITRRALGERWVQHRRKHEWWPVVAKAHVECYRAEWLALIAERAAIMSELPAFNLRSAVA